MRNCPTRDGKQFVPYFPKEDDPQKRRFMYSRLEEQRRMTVMVIMVSSCILLEYDFHLSGGVWLVDGLEGPRYLFCVHGV